MSHAVQHTCCALDGTKLVLCNRCLTFASSLSSSSTLRMRLTTGLFFIILARVPNLNVDKLSAKFDVQGEQQTIKAVRALPPSES